MSRSGEPSAVAASLERRLKRFRSGRSFISRAESGAFASELENWLDDAETQLLTGDPKAAWKLVERFIRADQNILERADDSNGVIGAAFRRACGLWHCAAAALPAGPEWVERVHALHAGNDYGTRDAILDAAAIRLTELELRRLARIYEREAESVPRGDESFRALAASAAMGQVAQALRDAALYERSVKIRSPRPNWLQALRIAEQYVEFGPVERAVEWLTGPATPGSERGATERLELLARAHEKLGNRAALLDARRQLYESSLDAERFSEYVALLPPETREVARREAVGRAGRSDDPVIAGAFLLQLGEGERAAAAVLRGEERLTAGFYEDLLSLAEGLEQADQPLAAVACYRALIDQILDAGRSTAYGYAKRYVDRLSALDATARDYRGLASHTQYLVQLRERHRLKSSFWRRFEASGPIDD